MASTFELDALTKQARTMEPGPGAELVGSTKAWLPSLTPRVVCHRSETMRGVHMTYAETLVTGLGRLAQRRMTARYFRSLA
jgi:hypothetical protein